MDEWKASSFSCSFLRSKTKIKWKSGSQVSFFYCNKRKIFCNYPKKIFEFFVPKINKYKIVYNFKRCSLWNEKMSLSLIGNEKSRRFFFHLREKCPRGRGFAPEGWLYSRACEGCNKTQGSKATPKGTLLSEIEQKSKGFLHFWCGMGLSFLLYWISSTFECFKPASAASTASKMIFWILDMQLKIFQK